MPNDSVDLNQIVAETPSVQAQVDPTKAKLGDLVTLDIRITHPPALIVDLPQFAKSLGTFEIYASTRLPSESNADKTVDHFQAQLQNFTTGPQLLPGILVPYKDPMGKVQTVKTPELTVTIEEVPPGPKDQGDIRGIKGVIGPSAWSPWWWLVLICIVLGVCAVWWRKRKRAVQGPPPPPPIPPEVTALKKLSELLATGWVEAGRLKEFHSGLSDILRGYIEQAFKTQALERTTNELMRDLRRKSDIPNPQQLELKELLDMCDLVKFAKFLPQAGEALASHAAAVRFVNQTQPMIPVQVSGNAVKSV